jgi:hypothetical protein
MIGCALRLVYLSVTNVFALLRLLPVSDRDKDVEILTLRHQVTILQRQLGTTRPRLAPGDRAFLAALLHRLAESFRSRPLDAGPYTFVWIDALTQKVREGGRTVNLQMAA